MRVSDLDYELPSELIAQRPLGRRDESRLLVYERASGAVRHRRFNELGDELRGDDLLVLNDTRVLHARLSLRRSSGGAVEVLLLEQRADDVWEALARPARRLRAGERLWARDSHAGAPLEPAVELLEMLGDGRWLARLLSAPQGELALPPYIREPLDDPDRYQTVFAKTLGSVAAPTAGLHLTSDLLAALDHAFATLHVGLDTFRPVSVETLEEHQLHGERYEVDARTWERVIQADRVVAVGTTTVRALESVGASQAATGHASLSGRTELMIAPGHDFRVVGGMVTNFHLPRSTLLALVMAFMGVDETREIYRRAIAERYRFYSFGDAMLIV